MVPPYRRTDITEPVSVRLMVVSSGKMSEPHTFVYTPAGLPKSPGMSRATHPCLVRISSGWLGLEVMSSQAEDEGMHVWGGPSSQPSFFNILCSRSVIVLLTNCLAILLRL
ncbi:hypothetical protein PR048_023162 [Dryococelus australis]|uniref:Rel homology dimerisation domain-containing protein n=1 Tax=Dryococelus australis TaxID=614101 RepID=A0ABQ9GTA3_9NEOP|nr:hypothetical protein PR048_023162 [Dryococelus australis]